LSAALQAACLVLEPAWLSQTQCISELLAYFPDMSQTLEKRVEDLERKVTALSAEILRLRPIAKDWRQTIGGMPDDEMARAAEKLGREYRQQQTYEKEIAGSSK
jgi:hypothetical protein